MKAILLTNGFEAIVDDEDYERLSEYKWSYDGSTAKRVGNITMAQEVLQTDEMIDHKHGDRLNNQKSNLRVCTPSQNQQNQRKTKKITSSKYKGVNFQFIGNKWIARIGVQDIFGKQTCLYLGSFSIEEEAAKAYDEAARHHHGKFACLNFPEEGERSCL